MATEFELIDEAEVLLLFQAGVRGGLVTMLNTKTELNDRNLPGYDSSKTETTAGMVDVNSLYPTVMVKKLPVGKPIDLTEEEMDGFMKHFEFARDNRDAILDKDNDLEPEFLIMSKMIGRNALMHL